MKHAKTKEDLKLIVAQIEKGGISKTKCTSNEDFIEVTLWNGVKWIIPIRFEDDWLEMTK